MHPLPPGLVERLHASGRRLVIALTGGGSGAIAALLRVPGASQLLLEAVVPYAPEALREFLGEAPEQACSEATASAMARRAHARAKQLAAGAAAEALLGVGVTASLATDRPKRGEHRCHVAVASAGTVDVTSIVLDKGRRSRATEEDVVARLVLLLLARACGVEAPDIAGVLGPGDRLSRGGAADPLRDLLLGRVARVTAYPDGRLELDAPRARALLPGSFNPFHEGHRELARAASTRVGSALVFELSVVNVDKPTLLPGELQRRLAQFRGWATVELTRAPTFVEKARLFPGATFVVGIDTAARIVEPRYYAAGEPGMHAALAEMAEAGCRFLVAGRLDATGRFATLATVPVPRRFASLFSEIPESDFRSDVSSSTLRTRSE